MQSKTFAKLLGITDYQNGSILTIFKAKPCASRFHDQTQIHKEGVTIYFSQGKTQENKTLIWTMKKDNKTLPGKHGEEGYFKEKEQNKEQLSILGRLNGGQHGWRAEFETDHAGIGRWKVNVRLC